MLLPVALAALPPQKNVGAASCPYRESWYVARGSSPSSTPQGTRRAYPSRGYGKEGIEKKGIKKKGIEKNDWWGVRLSIPRITRTSNANTVWRGPVPPLVLAEVCAMIVF